MRNLRTLQNQFINTVYNQEDRLVLECIKDGKASKAELMAIYRNNLYANLSNAIRVTYPRVYKLMGKGKFEKISQEFIKNNRSHSGNLDHYGDKFSDFLKEKDEIFLSDLAHLEWLEHQSYLAKDSKILDIELLQKLPPEKLFDIKFTIHPACYSYSSDYNLLGSRKQNKPLKKKVHFVIYRAGFDIEVEKISKDEFNFLSGMKEKLSLYQIYEKYEINVQNCLQKYLANGILSEFFVC